MRKTIALDVNKEFLKKDNGDENFLKIIITGDETWMYGYEKLNHHSRSQKGPHEQKKSKRSMVKH